MIIRVQIRNILSGHGFSPFNMVSVRFAPHIQADSPVIVLNIKRNSQGKHCIIQNKTIYEQATAVGTSKNVSKDDKETTTTTKPTTGPNQGRLLLHSIPNSRQFALELCRQVFNLIA